MPRRVKTRKTAGGFSIPDYRNIPTGIAEGRYGTLTEDNVRDFLLSLKGVADDDDILRLVAGISFYLGEYISIDARTLATCRATNREDLAAMIRDSKQLLERLREIEDRPFYVPETLTGVVFLNDAPADSEDHETAYRFNQAFGRRAADLAGPLAAFLNEAELLSEAITAGRRGRKSADAVGLIKIIAMFYSRYIGKPMSEPTGGFRVAVKWTLEHLGLPCEDPSRGIREALKNFKPSPLDKGYTASSDKKPSN
ncbi:MAG: hypothetical protein HPY65_00730 [Syntrophaceae bacterium]|nr:hypothetical protein [Syntrophaceae bacterium]